MCDCDGFELRIEFDVFSDNLVKIDNPGVSGVRSGAACGLRWLRPAVMAEAVRRGGQVVHVVAQ